MDWNRKLLDNIADEAAEWFTRLRSGELPEAARAEFALWLLRSPEHVNEYLGIARLWGDIDLIEHERSIDELIQKDRAGASTENVVTFPNTRAPAEFLRTPGASNNRPRQRNVVAASVLLALLGSLVWLARNAERTPEHL